MKLNLEKQLPIIKFGKRKLVDTEEYWRRKKAEVQADAEPPRRGRGRPRAR